MIHKENSILEETKELINLMETERKEQKYRTWCELMESTPENYKPELEKGLLADIELQPHRWMTAGVELIESFRGSAHVELMDGVKGESLHKTLNYPVFHFGCELFLKGMWLSKFEGLRKIHQNMHVDKKTRVTYDKELKSLGHNLINIINDLRKISLYSEDKKILQFLKIIEGIIRQYYYPLYEADKSSGWANSRYPKRFYNDSKFEGKADALHTFPDQSMIVKSFKEIEIYVDEKYDLRNGLIKKNL